MLYVDGPDADVDLETKQHELEAQLRNKYAAYAEEATQRRGADGGGKGKGKARAVEEDEVVANGAMVGGSSGSS